MADQRSGGRRKSALAFFLENRIITLVALLEHGWLDAKVEKFMWRQMKNAFDVDAVYYIDRRESIDAVLQVVTGKRVYLQPEATYSGTRLEAYEHPEDACYIFGRAGDNNMRHVEQGDDIVTVFTPKPVDAFAMNIAAMVLYDRMVKHVS